MGKEPESYEHANAKASRKIWPGCGDGRCRPCGRIHNYNYRPSGMRSYIDCFRCNCNFNSGCPFPIPEPVHVWSDDGSRCTKCGILPQWVGPNGRLYPTLRHVKIAGFSRKQVHLESERKVVPE